MGDVSHHRSVLRSIAASLALLALGGCGVVPSLVGDTAEAVMTPMNTLASQVNYGLKTFDSTVSTVANSVSSSSSQVARSASYVNNTTASTAAYTQPTMMSAPSLTSDQKKAIAKSKNAEQQDIPALPEETIAQLTVDQRGLQKAAQKAALTAPLGETIFWDQDGRSGSVMAKDEHKMGEVTCRTFEQSVTLDGSVHEGRATACRDEDSGRWMPSF